MDATVGVTSRVSLSLALPVGSSCGSSTWRHRLGASYRQHAPIPELATRHHGPHMKPPHSLDPPRACAGTFSPYTRTEGLTRVSLLRWPGFLYRLVRLLQGVMRPRGR